MRSRIVHPEHLNTPRQVYDENQQLRWKWDQQEPFGNSPPDENPAALGAFEFNLRFPGQYADKETGLHYNYFRDYAPTIGRYVQPDPLGRATTWPDAPRTGLNDIYAYVSSRPLQISDPLGLVGNTEGCGSGFFGPAIPNKPLGFDFLPCCARHDACYDDCLGPSKFDCDLKFCACVSWRCRLYPAFMQGACAQAATAYCVAVSYSSTGVQAFQRARNDCIGVCKPK